MLDCNLLPSKPPNIGGSRASNNYISPLPVDSSVPHDPSTDNLFFKHMFLWISLNSYFLAFVHAVAHNLTQFLINDAQTHSNTNTHAYKTYITYIYVFLSPLFLILYQVFHMAS